jgi:hypothetical protein
VSTTLTHRIGRVKGAFLLLLSLVPLRLLQLQLTESVSLNNHPFNRRLAERVAFRATIFARDKQVLAVSQGERRIYPQGKMTSHWVGFHHPQRGLAGAEAWKHDLLRERRGPDGSASQPGHAVRLSLDVHLQRRLDAALPASPCAAVWMDLESGQVLAAVSKPTFDPLRVTAEWHEWQHDPLSPTWTRYALGLYPAGELWPRWQSLFRALPARPAQVMDWTRPREHTPGTWLISPLHVAAAVLRAGSDLPLSQLYTAHRGEWRPGPAFSRLNWKHTGGAWEWSHVARYKQQSVAWGVRVVPPQAVVVLLEERSDAREAAAAARRALP